MAREWQRIADEQAARAKLDLKPSVPSDKDKR